MRRCVYAVLTLAVIAAGTGCGQGADKGGTGGPKELAFALPSLPATLIPAADPTLVQTIGSHYVGTLLAYADQPEGESSISSPAENKPAMASKYEETDEGLVFTLRKAKDSTGDVLEAEDVKYTFERMVATKDSIGTFVMTTAGIDLKKPVTVLGADKVRLNGKITPLGLLAAVFPYMSILNQDLVEKHASKDDPWAVEWLKTNTATFGPYRVSSYSPGKQMILEANKNYVDGAPAYPKVTVVAAGSQSVTQLLKAGSVQWSSSTPNSDYAQVKKDSRFHSALSVTTVQNMLQLSSSVPAFKDTDVRRAMSMALNREQLASELYHGVSKPATSLVSSAVPGVGELDSPNFEHDADEARKLLESTPYADGFEFTLAVNSQAIKRVSAATLGVSIGEMLKPLGIKVAIQKVENPAEFLAGAKAGKYDAFLNSNGPAVADAAYAMSLSHTSTAVLNYTKHSTPSIDSLIKQALAKPLGDERDKLALKAIEEWNSEMWDIPLIDESDAYVATKDVCGFATYPYMAVGAGALSPC